MPHNLVIVESPAKAKTIKRFLGKDFTVEASMGHIRDLPSNTIAVDVEKDFEPEYVVPKEKAAVVKKLRAAAKEADELWIATDEDREGEAIGWHLTQVLKEDPKKVKRIVFHEITETAIKEAVAHPRVLDMKLVDAQQARRVLDRLVGYTLSPFLWKKVYRGLSAGRVQSVAVKIIVDREREIKAFKADEYWTVQAQLQTPSKESFTAELQKRDGKKFVPVNQQETDDAVAEIKPASFAVASTDEKELKKSPAPPFTTSTLQQEAARKLGYSVKQTMVIAQQLYEGMSLGKGEGMMGLITYMRTDSVNLSAKALEDCKWVIEKHYGREYVLSEPRTYKTKSKGAQEAHEAIRPTELSRTPESLANVLDHQQLKLYTLIWNRTLATQMAAAELKRVGADISAGRYTFRATGQTILFDGFLRVYREDRDEGDRPTDEDVEKGDKLLPPLHQGDALDLEELKSEQHFTKPPPRYTEASLVKKLEEEGIGRPSTYAPTISTIQQRGYIKKEGKQLAPEDIAFTVTDLLAEHFTDIVDLAFTAKMEQSLDDIAEGDTDGAEFLRGFFKPFETLVKEKTKEIQKKDVLKERLLGKDPASGQDIVARTGRFGPYVQIGRPEDQPKKKKGKDKVKLKSASLPKHISVDDVTLEQALSLLAFPKDLGALDGETITLAIGRFGPYLKWGEVSVSLKDRDIMAVTFEEASGLVKQTKEQRAKAAEPLKNLGKDPETGGEILVKDGRFGPYVTDGKTNASLGKKFTPDTLTAEDAAELLKKKRERGPSKWRRRG
ncbi:MAG: type I DNA topoisomerase [Candidatus Peribacteraceae bacterium]|nr:type I DNA topoisomerase [Candidatus Peribacteraceae bacterium]